MRYLGIISDSENARFFVPGDKVEKYLALVRDALHTRKVTLQQLESIVGKTASFAVAVPAAMLHARALFRLLTSVRRGQEKPCHRQTHQPRFAISPTAASDLEIMLRLTERSPMVATTGPRELGGAPLAPTGLNGAPWYST